MKRINSLSDIFMEELSDLLNVENQLVEALPKMMEASQSSTLKLILEAHLEVTKVHARRLQDIFSNIVQSPQKVVCKTVKSLIEENESVVDETQKGPTRDIAIISVAQRVEQYEIASYQTACEHAVELQHTKIVELLRETLHDERSMYLHLNELAQGMINAQAIGPKSGGFYVADKKFARGGVKKKPKTSDVSRFISEGNPNIQDQNQQNPEEQGDSS